jgi:hypothetical protein
MWGLWWTKRHWGRFSPSTSVSSANHSTDFSIIITRGWHKRPIGGRSAEWTQLDSTPPHYTKKYVRFAVLMAALWRLSSWLWRRVVWYNMLPTLYCFHLHGRRYRLHIPPNPWQTSTRLHGVTPQKTVGLIFILLSRLTLHIFSSMLFSVVCLHPFSPHFPPLSLCRNLFNQIYLY